MRAGDLIDGPRYATPAFVRGTAALVASGPASITIPVPAAGNTLVGFYGSRTNAPSQAAHVAAPAWAAGTVYTAGQVVSVTAGSVVAYWRAVAGSTGVTPGTDPTKWTSIVWWAKAVGQGRGSSGSPQLSGWTKLADGTESLFTFADPGSSGVGTLSVLEFSGVNTAAPLDPLGGAGQYGKDGGSGTLLSLPLGPTGAPSTPAGLAVACIALSNIGTWGNHWSGGLAQRTSSTMQSTASATLADYAPSGVSTGEDWGPTARNAVGAILLLRPQPV